MGSLRGCGGQERCLRNGRKQMSLQSSTWARRRTQGISSQTVSPQSLEKWWSISFWGCLYPHGGGQEGDQHCQLGFTKVTLGLVNLVAFYNERPVWMHEGRAVGVVYLYFRWALDTLTQTSSGSPAWMSAWQGGWRTGWTDPGTSSLCPKAQGFSISVWFPPQPTT